MMIIISPSSDIDREASQSAMKTGKESQQQQLLTRRISSVDKELGGNSRDDNQGAALSSWSECGVVGIKKLFPCHLPYFSGSLTISHASPDWFSQQIITVPSQNSHFSTALTLNFTFYHPCKQTQCSSCSSILAS